LMARGADLHIACGHAALALHQLQVPSGRRVDTTAFLQARPLRVGDCLG
jgi:methionyl-tRNA formyltransferase